MEQLIGRAYGALSDGSDVVTVTGKNYTIDWTVTPIDLNGDATPEPNAVQLTVSVAGVPGASLTTIVVDNEGKVGKI